MNKKRFLPVLFLLLFTSSTFAAFPSAAYAITFNEIITGVKSFIPGSEETKKAVKIESSIVLVPEGDVNKDGAIDSGDIVRFGYKIINNTDNNYTFATLETNIDKSKLNFIHNITGTTGVNDNRKTVAISNLKIKAKQTANITFDARVNYITSEDTFITTEAEFISKDKKSIVKAPKKEIKAKSISEDNIRERFESKRQESVNKQ